MQRLDLNLNFSVNQKSFMSAAYFPLAGQSGATQLATKEKTEMESRFISVHGYQISLVQTAGRGGAGATEISNAAQYFLESSDYLTKGPVYNNEFVSGMSNIPTNATRFIYFAGSESRDTAGEQTEDLELAHGNLATVMQGDYGSRIKIIYRLPPKRTDGVITDAIAQENTDAGINLIKSRADFLEAPPQQHLALNVDGLHISDASYDTYADMLVDAFAFYDGRSTGRQSIGPRIAAVQLVGDTLIWDVTHVDGSDITVPAAPDEFRVLDDSVAVDVDAGAKVSATRFTLTLGAFIAAGSVIDLWTWYGACASVTDYVYDNSTYSLPIERISATSDYPVTVTQTKPATNGAYEPSPSNLASPTGTMAQRTAVLDFDYSGTVSATTVLINYVVSTNETRILLNTSGELLVYYRTSSSIDINFVNYGSIGSAGRKRIVVSWHGANGTFGLWINGAQVVDVTNITESTNTVSTIGMGQRSTGGNQLADPMNVFVDMDTAQSDEICLALSAV